jgi:hypothetical protein
MNFLGVQFVLILSVFCILVPVILISVTFKRNAIDRSRDLARRRMEQERYSGN